MKANLWKIVNERFVGDERPARADEILKVKVAFQAALEQGQRYHRRQDGPALLA